MNLLSGPRTYGGLIFSNDKEVGVTLMCPHCGKHFVSRPGSGARRSFCMKCMKTSCGSPSCDSCIPLEERLTVYENPRKLTSTKYADEIKNLVSSGAHLLS